MKLKMNVTKDSIAESTGGNFINKSGIYDIVIKFASIKQYESGAECVNFNVDYNGNEVTFYNTWITTKSGDPVESGINLLTKLGVIAGLEDGDDFTIEEETHNVGKDSTPTDFDVITDFSELPCKVHVQMKYSYDQKGEMREEKVVRAFFREDGASAEEIINDKEPGKQIALIQEKGWDTKVQYAESSKGAGDAPTEEDVEAWLEAKRNKNSTPTKGKVKSTATTKRRFGKS